MKTYKNFLLGAALLVLVVVGGFYAAYQAHHVRTPKTYYAMAGEVTIIDKFESRSNYSIVIEDLRGDQFTLSCSESDYDQVSVGDVVNCERYQSIVTYTGEVHKIKPIR